MLLKDTRSLSLLPVTVHCRNRWTFCVKDHRSFPVGRLSSVCHIHSAFCCCCFCCCCLVFLKLSPSSKKWRHMPDDTRSLEVRFSISKCCVQSFTYKPWPPASDCLTVEVKVLIFFLNRGRKWLFKFKSFWKNSIQLSPLLQAGVRGRVCRVSPLQVLPHLNCSS